MEGETIRKETIFTKEAPQPIGPYSQGIKAGNFIFTAGQLPIDPKTDQIGETIESQVRQVLLNLKAILNEAGADVEDVVKTTVYMKDLNDFQAMNNVYSEFFIKNPAARMVLEASRLPRGAKVAMDAIALKP